MTHGVQKINISKGSKLLSYNQKPNFHINVGSISIKIFLPKSHPILISILYRRNKYGLVKFLEPTFSDTNAIEIQKRYRFGDININLQPQDKEMFRNKSTNNIRDLSKQF